MRFWHWLLARLGAVAIVLAAALWYRMPSAGEKEFRRSIAALDQAHSLHYELIRDVPAQLIEQRGDLDCSEGNRHETQHTYFRGTDKNFSMDSERVNFSKALFSLQRNGIWKRGYDGLPFMPIFCEHVATKGHSMLAEFHHMLEHGVIEKGPKKKVNGELCREWRVTLRIRPGPLLDDSPNSYEHRVLCIGVADHLPREMTFSSRPEHWTYAFNVPVAIEMPSPLEPMPEQPVYRGPEPPPGLSLSNDNDD